MNGPEFVFLEKRGFIFEIMKSTHRESYNTLVNCEKTPNNGTPRIRESINMLKRLDSRFRGNDKTGSMQGFSANR